MDTWAYIALIAVLQTVFSILAASFGAILVKTTIWGTNSTPKNDFDKVYRSKSTAIYTEHSYENCFKIKMRQTQNYLKKLLGIIF